MGPLPGGNAQVVGTLNIWNATFSLAVFHFDFSISLIVAVAEMSVCIFSFVDGPVAWGKRSSGRQFYHLRL